MDISKIDKNFAESGKYEDMVDFNVNDAPFRLYGLCRNEGDTDFKRMPRDIAMSIQSQSVNQLYTNTSGIRVKFKTDSQRILISCVLGHFSGMAHMPLTGTSCFDMYADGEYCKVFMPTPETYKSPDATGYKSGYTFKTKEEREILINFPLYNNVEQLYISIDKVATLTKADAYKNSIPIVYYGSSITQGGCVSHAGNNYPAIISRHFDVDFINLGFSGGCKAEPIFADYIGSLCHSIFVYDYDHNASNVEYLSKTHNSFFKRYRKHCPDTPVIMISAADSKTACQERRNIIKATYVNALRSGDKNVYFLDGEEFYRAVGGGLCTVDGVHPNDLGFWCMATAVGDCIEKNNLL